MTKATRHVLVPLDGSELAESMLDRIPSVIRRPDVQLTLLSAVDTPPEADFIGAALAKEHATDYRRYLNRVARKLKSPESADRLGVLEGDVLTKVELGAAADRILEVADTEDSSLICMSTHGRSGVGRVLHGSVTERVVQASKRPVLVVPSFDRTEPVGGVDRRVWEFRSLVVALDGSQQSLQILPHAAELAARFGSKVTMLVVAPKDPSEDVERAVSEYLEHASKRFADAGVAAVSEIRQGQPAEEILDYAARYDHDAILMTTHGRSAPSRWMLGSVAAKVVRHATVPVLVVRNADES